MNSRWVKSESILNDSDSNDDASSPLPKPGGPLKPRFDAVQKLIQVQTCQLEELNKELRSSNENILRKLVASIKESNVQYSAKLSSELARERKERRIVFLSRVALEKLADNLSSVSDFGDLVIVVSPAMVVVKNLRSSLTPHAPEIEEELGIISELLSGILVDAGQVGGYTINFETANESAVRLIEEASQVVEQQMRQDFPDIPDLPVISKNLI